MLDWASLEKHRIEVRRAELGAWIHNLGKLSPEFVRSRKYYRFLFGKLFELAGRRRPEFKATHQNWGTSGSAYLRDGQLWRDLRPIGIEIPGLTDDATHEPFCVSELVEFHLKRESEPGYEWVQMRPLLDIMVQCHGEASGEEKHLPWKKETEYAQPKGLWPWYRISPFGYPETAYQDEDATWKLQQAAVDEINRALRRWTAGEAVSTTTLKKRLDAGVADSQIPINDISVGDMGLAGAALLKACLVNALLTKQTGTWICTWRLMRIAVDALSYLENAVRIPDLLARREGVEQVLDRVRDHLEAKACLANEVYRDETGSVFIIPGFGSREYEREFDEHVKAQIESVWRQDFGLEFGFEIHRSDAFSNHSKLGSAFELGRLLEQPAPAPLPRPQDMDAWWGALKNRAHQREPCSACRLRPISEDDDVKRRRICNVCFKRRARRAEKWLDNRSGTIWLDEAADKNRRFALLAGRFRIESWLSRESYLTRTIFTLPPKDLMRMPRAKEPERGRNISDSAGRMRRIFETTQDFWTAGLEQIRERVEHQEFRAYLKGKLIHDSAKPHGVKRPHAYELVVKETRAAGRRISAVWDGASFHIVENLFALAKLLQRGEHDEQGVKHILKEFLKGKFDVMHPTGYVPTDLAPARAAPVASFEGVVEFESISYPRMIHLMDDPRQMFVVAPASDAMAAAEVLLELFEQRMGRVRNRLAMDVAAIFAPVHTPLRALIDAARRVLDRSARPEKWRIRCISTETEFVHITFENGVCWRVPITLPKAAAQRYDRKGEQWITAPIPDHHFPYFEDADGRLLHVSKLRAGMDVRVEPSFFDFEFLDSASRRFEIAYGPNGHRQAADRAHRPYPLENVKRLREIWEILDGHISDSQIHWLEGILAAKQQEWGSVPEDFIRNVLRNLEWIDSMQPDNRDTNLLVSAALSGLLHDSLELYRGVMKGESE